MAESFIDLKYYIIPDSLSIYAAPVAMAGMWGLETMHPDLGIGLEGFYTGGVFLVAALLAALRLYGYSFVVMKAWDGAM